MLETSEDTTASGKGVLFYTLLSSVNFPFRPASAGHVYGCPGYYVKRSKRSEAYILYTLSGKGEMTWKGETVSLTPGSVCIIHCEEYHYYKTTSTDCPWEYYYVHFTGSGLDAYSGYLLDKPRCLFPKDPESFLQKMKYLTTEAIDSNPPLLDSKCSKILAELMDALLEVSTLTAPPLPCLPIHPRIPLWCRLIAIFPSITPILSVLRIWLRPALCPNITFPIFSRKIAASLPTNT